MRWTSRSWLWGLLAVLLFGVVLMHHAPSHGTHDPEPVLIPAATAGLGQATTGSPAAHCPCGATEHDALPPDGAGDSGLTALLHLCLAVLTALGGLVATGLLLCQTVSLAARHSASRGWCRPGEFLRWFLPVPRRLAALCVFRL